MRTIEIDEAITVSNLAERLDLPATTLVAELFKNSIRITLNEKIDFETVQILVAELGLDVELQKKAPANEVFDTLEQRESQVVAQRPPVVAMMGHVDHGKTSLLDKILGSKVVEQESGQITQHITAHQVNHGGRDLTFLDTPGHEAFAALREHGAVLTDVVVIVVAADEGVQPQTLEAIRFAQKTEVKMIVAANKIDKQGANLPRLKQQLAEADLLPEEMGGEITVVPVSAKTGEGLDQLLDLILLLADIEELTADSQGPASGLVIESYMKKGLGSVAVLLVQAGVLSLGDYLVAGGAFGRVRLLTDTRGKDIKKATASMPVIVSGLKTLPEFGDQFYVVKNEKQAKKLATSYLNTQGAKATGMTSSEMLRLIKRHTVIDEHYAIVKADVNGSLVAVINGIKSLDRDEVATRIIGSGVGAVTENDIRNAKATGATIYCFHLDLPTSIKRLANQQEVTVKNYEVIYKLLDDVREILETKLQPEVIETNLGTLRIKGVFNTTKTDIICGGQVVSGQVSLPASARVVRSNKQLAQVEIANLKKGVDDATQVFSGEMCGLNLITKSKLILKEDDLIEVYRQEVKQRKLSEE